MLAVALVGTGLLVLLWLHTRTVLQSSAPPLAASPGQCGSLLAVDADAAATTGPDAAGAATQEAGGTVASSATALAATNTGRPDTTWWQWVLATDTDGAEMKAVVFFAQIFPLVVSAQTSAGLGTFLHALLVTTNAVVFNSDGGNGEGLCAYSGMTVRAALHHIISAT